MLYNNLSGYFREKYGKRLSKICIDGGFSCPNRDGKCGTGGCIFCGERGAGEHINPALSISEQVKNAIAEADEGDEFVAYFQNFTNTYAPVSVLKERYDAALSHGHIRVLAIGTRPDCIDEEIASLIASYKDRVDVWVELGLQTANDETAELINRGYKREAFTRCMQILKKYDIPAVVHLIVGLPGEDMEDIRETVKFVNGFMPFGVKIHSMYVMAGTRLAEMYQNGSYCPISKEEYVSRAVYIITHLHPATIVHRLTGDCPQDLLVAPEWNKNKNETISAIVSRMQFSAQMQGSEYGKF